MSEYLEKIGWSKRHFGTLMSVDERTVHEWCSGRSQGSGYRAAMKYLELVVRFLG